LKDLTESPSSSGVFIDNVEELVLEGNTLGSCVNFRRKLGHDLRAGILERCSSERLAVIYLVHLKNVPLCLLSLAPRLESLALQSVSFAPELDHHAIAGGPPSSHNNIKERRLPARLKAVYVRSTTSKQWRTLYPWLEHVHLDLTHIKTLELHIDFKDARKTVVKKGFQAISNLIRGCSAALETLHFFIPDESRFPFRSFV